MRAVLLALLAVGALHGLPAEDGSGLQEEPSVAAAAVAPDGSGDFFKIFDNQIRAKDDGGIAVDYAHPAKDDKKAISKRSNFAWSAESDEDDVLRRRIKAWREEEPTAAAPMRVTPDYISLPHYPDDVIILDAEEPRVERSIAQQENNKDTKECLPLSECIDDNECGDGGECLNLVDSVCKCTQCVLYPTCAERGDCYYYESNETGGTCDCYCAKGNCFCPNM